MDIAELDQIAAEKHAKFIMRVDGETFVIKAKPDVVKEILALIDRDEVLALLRARDGFTDEIEHIVAPKVKSLAQYSEEYDLWCAQRSEYYKPKPEQKAKMWSVLEEGDRLYFDYALTITVRRIRDGRLVAIDRRGRETPVSPYSSALQQQGK
jgi:hypothetical protein